MHGKDNEIRIREIFEGDPKKLYDSRAYHNEQGMYVMPDAEKFDGEMVLDEDRKLYVPKPKEVKQTWIIAFEFGQSLEVEEAREEIQEAINRAYADVERGEVAKWYIFTDPIFGTELSVPAASLVKTYSVYANFRDMEHTKWELEVKAAMQRKQRFEYSAKKN